MNRIIWLALTLPLLASATPHGEGILTADRTIAAPGQVLKLKGTQFEAGESYRIKLVGVLQEFSIATVSANTDGSFALDAMMPVDAAEGSYRLDVVAADGDVSSGLDVTLLATVAIANETSTEPGVQPTAQPMGRGDQIVVRRDLTGATWGLLGAVIGLSGGLGVGLLLRREGRSRELTPTE